MANTFVWGHWKEEWTDGQFRCVFVEAPTESGGIIRAAGLYRATPGESFGDLHTYQERIAERTAITADANGLLVQSEFAELLATLPSLLQEASKRHKLLRKHGMHQQVR